MRSSKTVLKRIMVYLLASILCLGSVLTGAYPVRAEEASSSVIISVERFALGKGWIVEPEVVPMRENDTVSSLLTRFMDEQGYPLIVDENTSYGWYLEGITDGDNEEPLQIPDFIKEKAKNDGNNLTDNLSNEYAPDLKEFSYADDEAGTNTSGWIYSVNNDVPGHSMDKQPLNPDDVIRIQFSLYGTGLDVSGEAGMDKLYERADKSELLRKLAYIGSNTEGWLEDEEDWNAYDEARRIAQKLDADESEVQYALDALPDESMIWPESIVLSENDMTLYDNDSAGKLEAVIYPEDTSLQSVTWSSSDPEVVSVDQKGRITPHQVGIAVIEAMTQNGISDQCEVNVIPRPFSSISLDQSALSMEAQNTAQLNVTGYPDNATEDLDILWSSSDPSVADVSEDGLVTAYTQGTATIKTEIKDSEISASCNVTVGDAKELAQEAKSLIEALPKAGELVLDDYGQVMQARDAYESLSEESREYITDKEAVESKLSRCILAIEQMTSKYKNVKLTEDLIQKIPSLSVLDLNDRKLVEEASKTYDGLKKEEKILVDPALKKRLEQSKKHLNNLVSEIQKADELMEAIPSEITLEDSDTIIEASDHYQAFDDTQREQLNQDFVKKLNTALDQIQVLITNTVSAIDTEETLQVESSEVQNFIKAVSAYNSLKDVLELPEDLDSQIENIKKWIGNGIHTDNGVHADSYWNIQTHAEETTEVKDAVKALKKKYKDAEKPKKAWDLSYTDIRDQSVYEQDKSISMTFSIKELSKMENPMVFGYSDKGLKKYKASVDKSTGTISINTAKSGLFFVADVPVPLTGLDLKNRQTVAKGSTIKLSPVQVPSNSTSKVDYVWKSSDSSIAAVDSSGNVTGKKGGTAKVTVSVKGKEKIKANTKITVVTKSNFLPRDVTDVLKETEKYVRSTDTSPTIGSEWYVISLARSGVDLSDPYFAAYYNHLANYLKEKDGVMTNSKYSDYSKTILTVTAIGKDASNVGGYNLLKPLADFSNVKKQGVNGPIWALIALKSHPDYNIPKVSGVSEQTTEKKLIDYLLEKQLDDGGWALSGNYADTDITAMALQSLAPYYNKDGYENVTQAIEKALKQLGKMQTSTGGYKTMGAETSESTAQVVTALTALEIDPGTDSRFIKNGKWTVENLMSYHVKGSGFMHVKAGAGNNGGADPGVVDGMATGQGFYSLVAYQRFQDGKTSLYDMSDLKPVPGGSGDGQGYGDIKDTNSAGSEDLTKSQSGPVTENTQQSDNPVVYPGGDESQETAAKGSAASTPKSASKSSSPSKSNAAKKSSSKNSTAKKKASSKKKDGDKKEKDKSWSFDGDNYKPIASDKKDTSQEKKNKKANTDDQQKAKILTKENAPYAMSAGSGLALIAVCIYFKKRI